MRVIRVIGALLLVGIISFCGPQKSDQRTPSRKKSKKGPSLNVKLDKPSPVSYGDTIQLTFSFSDTSAQDVTYNITQIDGSFALETKSKTISIPTSQLGGGSIRMKCEAILSNGLKSSRYKELDILAPEKPRSWELKVLKKYHHDRESFTQGLEVVDGVLYEGTGNYGGTRLRKLEIETGKVLQEMPLEDDIFGEGITVFNDKLYQLTYKSSRAFVYDAATLEREREHAFDFHTGEGWGLTHNDSVLIASDGSPFLYFLNPANFSELKRIKVFDNLGEIELLNELEYRNGALYANIYTSAEILIIDPKTGLVTDRIVARGIVDQADATRNMDVLNGIAFNPKTGNMLVTGKYWSKLYEVQMVPVTN